MCREQLPVWQREWPDLRTPSARLVTVAADSDIDAVRKWAGRIDATTLVDTQNRLAKILRFRVIPNGYLFARDGTLLREKVSGFDLLREPSTRDLVRAWLRDETAIAKPPRPGVDDAVERALELFAEGEEVFERGERDRALALWHAAYLLDPRSFVVRKQIWRALYPERFGDRIDLDWQREQIAREDSLGFGAANAALPAPARV